MSQDDMATEEINDAISSIINTNITKQEKEDSNISSDEETRRRKLNARRNTWKKGLPVAEDLRKMVPADLSSSNPVTAKVEFPVFESLDRLLQVFPYLQPTHVVCKKANAKRLASGLNASTSSSSTSALANTYADEHALASVEAETWQTKLLQEKEKRLTTPEFFLVGVLGAKLSQEALTKHLRDRQLVLPILDADLMQELLSEAGEFHHPRVPVGEVRRFPPCKKGVSCVGLSGVFKWRGPVPHGKHKGIIFTSLMYDYEYNAFLKHNQQPPVRECIACCIKSLTEFIYSDRTLVMNSDNGVDDEDREEEEEEEEYDEDEHNQQHQQQTSLYVPLKSSSSSSSSSSYSDKLEIQSYTDVTSPTSSSSSSASSNNYNVYGRIPSTKRRKVYQLFRNKVNTEGGFFREYTLCDPDADDVYIDPVLRLNSSTVRLRCDQPQHVKNERTQLDISMTRWQPKIPEQQKQGERESVF